ncbi:hypothetical protein [Vibrio barjaei]|uniref:hypothetical protein n=1 Tax=Vibrio barjaei TaxID=1676683 RepID=UPI0022851769|nr:hypothetical protein [Vibrio barjaei]MCY9873821.1 hypothetical protein [Vibrio barjaei]
MQKEIQQLAKQNNCSILEVLTVMALGSDGHSYSAVSERLGVSARYLDKLLDRSLQARVWITFPLTMSRTPDRKLLFLNVAGENFFDKLKRTIPHYDELLQVALSQGCPAPMLATMITISTSTHPISKAVEASGLLNDREYSKLRAGHPDVFEEVSATIDSSEYDGRTRYFRLTQKGTAWLSVMNQTAITLFENGTSKNKTSGKSDALSNVNTSVFDFDVILGDYDDLSSLRPIFSRKITSINVINDKVKSSGQFVLPPEVIVLMAGVGYYGNTYSGLFRKYGVRKCEAKSELIDLIQLHPEVFVYSRLNAQQSLHLVGSPRAGEVYVRLTPSAIGLLQQFKSMNSEDAVWAERLRSFKSRIESAKSDRETLQPLVGTSSEVVKARPTSMDGLSLSSKDVVADVMLRDGHVTLKSITLEIGMPSLAKIALREYVKAHRDIKNVDGRYYHD